MSDRISLFFYRFAIPIALPLVAMVDLYSQGLHAAAPSQGYVTYEFSGGRFGDSLLCYLHAKWLSYQSKVPLLYRPFSYSDALCLDEKEMRYQPFYTSVMLNKREPYPSGKRCIFVCPYFSEDPSNRSSYSYRFDVDWDDKEFRKIVREMIAPKRALALAVPPSHTVNIAIHIREGGGYDTDHTRLWDPLKLPPLPFYIEGLRKVLDQFRGRPIYCYLFTDALDPAGLAVEFEKAMPLVRFDYRRENNHHTANVLEDFFSFLQFDVLIHPQSNYSIVASHIHDFAIDLSPHNFERVGTKITITETTLKRNEALFQQVLDRTGPL